MFENKPKVITNFCFLGTNNRVKVVVIKNALHSKQKSMIITPLWTEICSQGH